jgi:hypothetical protein
MRISCGVRDLSREGAGLRLTGMTLIPIDFNYLSTASGTRSVAITFGDTATSPG